MNSDYQDGRKKMIIWSPSANLRPIKLTGRFPSCPYPQRFLPGKLSCFSRNQSINLRAMLILPGRAAGYQPKTTGIYVFLVPRVILRFHKRRKTDHERMGKARVGCRNTDISDVNPGLLVDLTYDGFSSDSPGSTKPAIVLYMTVGKRRARAGAFHGRVRPTR